MIYTTYFANLRHLPPNVTPVSIAAQKPKWYNGAEYKKLAPPRYILSEYKETKNVNDYIFGYNKCVLRPMTIDQFMYDLSDVVANDDIALVCYETPDKFCHRQLVAKWLNGNGVLCKEIERR